MAVSSTLVATAVGTLGAYALATRLWGWEYGVVAAALTGLVLTGAHTGLNQGRYPDLTAAYFLMVMLVAALVTLHELPSLRSGLLVTVTGASVVLYHPVASMYLALLLALVGVTGLPYLLRQGRRKFLKPLYQKLAETPEGLERARRIYAKARPMYHAVSYRTIDSILKWPG